MADIPNPSCSDLAAGGGGQTESRPEAATAKPAALGADRRVVALAAGAGARYKAMSPARLPISREPCLTIPPGFSPSALLESPVLLTNLKVEPSPTTGTLNMPSIMNRIVHSDLLPSPREKSTNNTHEDGGSRDFEFKPPLRSSFQSAASANCDLPKHEPSMQKPIQNPSSSSSSHLVNANKAFSSHELTLTVNASTAPNQPAGIYSIPAEIATSTAEMNDSEKSMQEPQSDLNETSPLNVAEKSAEDGYNWRKYGQKHVKGSENPRSYYKCTHPNCEVKKLLERSHDGQITEVVYKGRHSHPKPQPNRRLAAGTVTSSQGEERYDGVTAAEDKSSNTFSHLVNQVNPVGTTEPFPGSISDDDIDTGGGRAIPADDIAEDDDLESKRRKMDTAGGIDAAMMGKPNREPRVVVQTVSEVDILDDGYRWRKYGQKVVKGNPNPRSYYKCTNIGCPVRKHVERASHDPKSVITTYEGKHNHEVPASRNASHEMAAPTVKTVVHPINNTMPRTLSSMLRACETRAFANQYSQEAESDTISLDLGVGISPNHGDAPSVPDQMQYHQMQSVTSGYSNMGIPAIPVPPVPGNAASSMYGSREDKGGEGFTFKTAPLDHSPNLCYSGAGNLVLGP